MRGGTRSKHAEIRRRLRYAGRTRLIATIDDRVLAESIRG
jgi:hypothetical protein